jgi:hypothetical protein
MHRDGKIVEAVGEDRKPRDEYDKKVEERPAVF